MDSWPAPIRTLVEGVRAWASPHPKVKGLALVGSWARGGAKTDSDVDLILLTDEVAPFIEDASWVGLFGALRQTEVESWGDVRSIRAWYRDGPEVEFGLATMDWISLPLDPGTEHVIRNGMIILHDPFGSLAAARRSVEEGSTKNF